MNKSTKALIIGASIVGFLIVAGIAIAFISNVASTFSDFAEVYSEAKIESESADNMNAAIDFFVEEYWAYKDKAKENALDVNNLTDEEQRVYGVVKTTDINELREIEKTGKNGIKLMSYTHYPANYKTIKALLDNFGSPNNQGIHAVSEGYYYWYSPEIGKVLLAKMPIEEPMLYGILKDYCGDDTEQIARLMKADKWINISDGDIVRCNFTYSSGKVENASGFYEIEAIFYGDGSGKISIKDRNGNQILDASNHYYPGDIEFRGGSVIVEGECVATVMDGGEQLLFNSARHGQVTLYRIDELVSKG